MKKVFSYSGIQTFKDCRRRYYYRYIMGLVPRDRGSALSVGGAVHKTLERILRHSMERGETIGVSLSSLDSETVRTWCMEDYRTHTTPDEFSPDDLILSQEMLVAWVRASRHSNLSEMKVVGVEVPFSSRIRSGRSSVPVKGFIDAIVEYRGTVFPLEHKTVSGSVTDRRLHNLMFTDQPSMYLTAVREMFKHSGSGASSTTMIYNFLPKSSVARAAATPFDRRKYKSDGSLYANMRETDESDAEYAVRLAEWYASNEDKFLVHMTTKSSAQLQQYHKEVVDIRKDISNAARLNRWYRNPSACQMYSCPFASICLEQFENPDGNSDAPSALDNYDRDTEVAVVQVKQER